jgi:hypothetical protein
MERRDIMVIVGALLVVLILAVVVKPMLTGQPVDLGIPQVPVTPAQIDSGVAPITQEPVAPQVPIPEETEKTSEDLTAPYHSEEPGSENRVILPEPTTVTWQPDPSNPMPAIQMVQYADIVGKYTGSTGSFRIPTPYWEITYNVTPAKSEKNPTFIVDIIKEGLSGEDDKTVRTLIYREGKSFDPKEGRFFEGGHDYYLRITAENLDKYQIIIYIPLKYIPDT